MRCEWVEGMHNCGAAMWRRLEVSASPARLAARPNPAILTPAARHRIALHRCSVCGGEE